MSREKQIIEEMARDICECFNNDGTCYQDDKLCDCKCDSFTDAQYFYEKGYRKQEWISVEDGEPEEATNVLCIENENYYLAFLEDGVWFDCVSFYRDDTFTQVFPTHWMPLPEAPKMKGDQEKWLIV